MPGIVHTTLSFTRYTHLVRDEVQMSFTFSSATRTAIAIAAGQAEILSAWLIDSHHSGDLSMDSVPLVSFLGNSIDRTVPVMMRCYALSTTSSDTPDVHAPGSGFGSPIETAEIPLAGHGAMAGTDIPEQVCVVLSYHGNLFGLAEHSGAGPRPAQRHRGRLYFGPLCDASKTQDPATHAPVVAAALLPSIQVATQKTLLLTGDTQWSVWSRKNNKVDAVVGGFIDNRFDTQRRRAEDATFRQSFSGTGT